MRTSNNKTPRFIRTPSDAKRESFKNPDDPKITLYWIRGSQPARAVYTFMQSAGITFDDVELTPGQ